MRSQFFECLRENSYKHALEHLEAARPEQRMGHYLSSAVDAWLMLNSLKAGEWSGHIFAPGASPKPFNKILGMSPSSAVHGGQYDPTYVTLE